MLQPNHYHTDTSLEPSAQVSKKSNSDAKINLNICFGCSKEPSYKDCSVANPQHMFWLSLKKMNF